MPITFKRAPIVAPGDYIRSEQMRDLARALNDRLLSGIADCARRVWFYCYEMGREIRNPDEGGNLVPPFGEWMQYYMHLPATIPWPDAEPGEPEGLNLGAVLPAFVYGNPSVDSEDVRLQTIQDNDPKLELYWEGHPPATPEECFLLGVNQRGIIDPATGTQNAPALLAAQSHFKIVQRPKGPHGRAYGGYLPTPLVVGDCEDVTGVTTPSYQIKFTNLHGGADKVYAGTCQGVAGHVQWVATTPFGYYVKVEGAALEYLSNKDWLQGPYTGKGALQKVDGRHLARVLQFYAMGYRGTDDQLAPASAFVGDFAFEFERFFSSQCFFAPARGRLEGGNLVADYPTFTATGATTIAAGTLLPKVGGGTSHAIADGFVLGGFLLRMSGLTAAVSIEVLDGTSVLRTVTLAPADTGGKIELFEDGPAPAALKFRLKTAATFATTEGMIEINCMELLRYKPEIYDAYLAVRLGSAGSVVSGVDNGGATYPTPKAISNAYFANGMLTNLHGTDTVGGQDSIGQNPVYEAARAVVRNCTRLIPADQFVKYGVTGGKSELHFRRLALGAHHADSFWGIAPPEGETEGIVTVAPPEGWTNRWCMWVDLMGYKDSDSSIWKLDAYADIYAFSDRCHCWSPWISGSNHQDLAWHFGYGILPLVAPEGVTAYRYADGVNYNTGSHDAELRQRNFRSCQVHEPPLEVESATVYIEGGEQFVKIVLKGRLKHDPAAPSTISTNIASWETDQLDAEAPRYEENGLREWLLHKGTGRNCHWKVGDAAIDSELPFLLGNPYGSCVPHFYFVSLIPEPHADDNDVMDDADTPVVAKVVAVGEMYVAAFCNGFMDAVTTASYGCQTGEYSMYDFSYENLCFQAFGGRSLSLMPVAVRGDGPEVFGPMPNVTMWAEPFSNLSRMLNLLTRAKVDLPMDLECQYDEKVGTVRAENAWPPGTECITSGELKAVWSGAPAAGSVVSTSEWSPCGGSIVVASGAHLATDCDGTDFQLRTTGLVARYRLRLADPDALLALPAGMAELLENGASGFVGVMQTSTERTVKVQTADSGETAGCCLPEAAPCPGFFYNGAEGFGYRFETDTSTVTTCGIFSSGVVDPGTPPAGDFYVGRAPGGETCGGGSIVHKGIEVISGSVPGFVEVPLV